MLSEYDIWRDSPQENIEYARKEAISSYESYDEMACLLTESADEYEKLEGENHKLRNFVAKMVQPYYFGLVDCFGCTYSNLCYDHETLDYNRRDCRIVREAQAIVRDGCKIADECTGECANCAMCRGIKMEDA